MAAARALLGLAAGKGRAAAAAASGRGPLAAAPLLAGRATTAPPLTGRPRAPPLAGQPRASPLLAHQAPPLLAGRSTLVAALLGAPPRVAGLRLLRPAPLPALGLVRFSTGGTNHGDGDGKIDASVPEGGADHILADSSAKPKPDAARGTDGDNATDNGLKPDATGKDEHQPKPRPDGDNATNNELRPDTAGKDESKPKPAPVEVGIHTTAVAVPHDSTGKTLGEHNDKRAGSKVPGQDKEEEVDGKDGKAATGENQLDKEEVVVDSEEGAGKVRIDTVMRKDTTEGTECTEGYRLEELLKQNNKLLEQNNMLQQESLEKNDKTQVLVERAGVQARVGQITQTLVIGSMMLVQLAVAGLRLVMYGVSLGIERAQEKILELSQEEKTADIMYNLVALLVGCLYQKGKKVVVDGASVLGARVVSGATTVTNGLLSVAGAAWRAVCFWRWGSKVEEGQED